MIDYGPGLDATLNNLIKLVQALPAEKQAQAKCLCNQAILDGTTEAVAAELSALLTDGTPAASGDEYVLEELQTPGTDAESVLGEDDSRIMPADSGIDLSPDDSGLVRDSDIVHGRCGSSDGSIDNVRFD